jgi:tRNA threonylcarbamoyl adenosine modification protein (Sua5/YciO/YrdC/YwlC family)
VSSRAFLFDLDGTLVDTGGAGRRAVTGAFLDLYGVAEAFEGQDFSGATDPVIYTTAMRRRLGRDPDEAERDRFNRRYLDCLDAELHSGAPGYRVLPGVPRILAGLSVRPGVLCGLCTGNLREAARLKLGPGGLARFFAFGGFGSDSGDRAELTRAAWRRAEALAGGPVDALVIGDSPLDFAAARAAGARVALVGTGWTPLRDLAALGPDLLFPSFADWESAIPAILGMPAPLRVGTGEVVRAVRTVRDGGVLVYPTATLYGLGCDAARPEAVERVRRIKGKREAPFILLGADSGHGLALAAEAGPRVRDLASRFWPGPLTLVLQAGPSAPADVVGPEGTVAVRVDAHPFPAALAAGAGAWLVSTSANPSGGAAPASAKDVHGDVIAGCDLFVADPEPLGGVPSTVVRVRGDTLEVLRPGAIPAGDL